MDIQKTINSIKNLFSKKEPLPAGMYAYQTPPDFEKQYRLHLRIEEDGTGILIINASTVLHLNQTAVEYAYHIIRGSDMETVVHDVSHRYQIDQEHIRQDFEQFNNRIQTMIDAPNLDPVTYLDIERQEPYSEIVSAPYRLDCAVTYQVPEESHRDTAPVDRVDRELSTDEWETIFHKAFEAGIPHLLFTGGEPTTRQDLPELILKAEEIGMVTGLLTDGLKLENDTYRRKLLINGLDHLMIVFDPDNPLEWQILEKVLADELFTTVHLTLRKGENLKPHIQRLASMGTQAISLSETNRDLTDELQELRDYAAVYQLDLVWDMPVPYAKNNPVSLELENDTQQEPPEGAGKAWLYVEPDGDVLPAQGMYKQVLGNMLTDPWDAIWQKK